ncbi:MAG: SpoIIE family protein phosphatase [Candidatus Eisenbacteria bacterium]|nr:SpoIIE family protein phosphatase [Candidatus Eisenbacteria bacterium]
MNTTPARGPDLAFLFEASRRLNRVLELESLLHEIRDIFLEAVDAEAVTVLIWDEDKTHLEFQLAFNRADDAVRRLYLRPGEGLAGWVAENDRSVIVNDVREDGRYKHEIDRVLGFTTRSVLGIPIHRGRTVVGVLEIANRRHPDGFTEADLEVATALADPVAVALENALLYRDLQIEKAENEALYRIGTRLSQTIEMTETLETILDLIAEVLPYDAAGIALTSGDPPIVGMVATRGYPPSAERSFRLKVGQGAVGWVVKTGEALRIADVSSDRRYFAARPDTRSELVVPLHAEGKVIGACNLESDELDAYRPRHVRMLLSFANLAAVTVGRVRLQREVLRRQRLQDEVELARRIQQDSLPASDPRIPGYEVSGNTIPSHEVGGDGYDLIPITSGQYGFVIADVAGKGIPAALILASFRAALRAEVRHQYEIRTILSNVNRFLWESLRPDQFVTAIYGVLDLRPRVFTYTGAGHNPPILVRADGTVEWLRDGGLILGVFQDAVYPQKRLPLRPGDCLLLYTDGAIDAADASGEEFGEARLAAAFAEARGRTAAEIRVALEEAILRHCGGEAQDDVTLVVLKVAGS